MIDYTKRQSRFQEPTKLFLVQLFIDMILAFFGYFLLNNKKS